MKLRAITTIICLLVLFGVESRVNGWNGRNLQQDPTTSKVGGSVWYHTVNLLQNADASSSTVNPPWTQSSVTWTVVSGPSALGIDTSDGSPWFLNSGGLHLFCSTCFNTRIVTLAQTVSLPIPAGFLNTYQTYFEYGGDAFAAGTRTGNGASGLYRSQAAYEASYLVEFLGSSGQVLATDTSGPIFNSIFGCPLLTQPKQSYGYRRTVTGVPIATKSVRFTATMIDRLTVCYNYSTSATFNNGFDNLWLDFAYLGLPSAHGRFKPGPQPGPSVRATITRKRIRQRRPTKR